MRYVIGVDVGTGSTRAGLFDETGTMLANAEMEMPLHRPRTNWVEQSSTLIWQAVCSSVRSCLEQTDITPEQVQGISFSAACSLVILDTNDKPLILSEGEELWDTIVWMDHRATAEAKEINSRGSEVLANLGDAISPEMQIPKLMWLKRNRPDLWENMGFAGDLADFLAYKCSGSNARSVCTLGCKWTYNPDNNCWNKTFLSEVNLDDLLTKANLPERALPVGTNVGMLTNQAAEDLGLTTACKVATGLIDAHAGALGTLGLADSDKQENGLALIAGTSNCHIALSKNRQEVPGIWGPYAGAVKNNMWANEGGQSATGALLDHIVELFGAERFGDKSHDAISREVIKRGNDHPDFAGDIYVIPDFIGNRSPFADPAMKGAIMGLALEEPEESFFKIYWASAASIAYGTRLIIDRLNQNRFDIDTIYLSGGHKNSELLVGLYADATGCNVIISTAREPVLLGAAIAALSQFQPDQDICDTISFEEIVRKPKPELQEIHNARYQKFLDFYDTK